MKNRQNRKKRMLTNLLWNRIKNPKSNLLLKRKSISRFKAINQFLKLVHKKHKWNWIKSILDQKNPYLHQKPFQSHNKMKTSIIKKLLNKNLSNKLSKTIPFPLWYFFFYFSKNSKRWQFINQSIFSWKSTSLVLIKLTTTLENSKQKSIIP